MSYQREYSDRVRVGVVGVGRHCYRNILPALHYLPARLAAVCDMNPDAAQATAAQFGDCRAFTDAGEMFRSGQIDAALLVVGAGEHPRLAIQAMEAGLHVWMEKPAAMRASEVEAMIAGRGDRVAVVGFKKVFMPSARKALELVAAAKSPLRTLLAVYPMDLPVNGAEVLEKRQSTNWLANACHPLSLIIAAGGKPTEVISHRGQLGGGTVIIRFAGGVQGTFQMSSGPWPNERYSFFGGDFHVEIDNSLRVTAHRFIPFDYGRTTDYAPPGTEHGSISWEPQNTLSTLENNSLVTQGIWDELNYFLRSILDKTAPTRGTLEFALDVMRVYEAALLSDGDAIPIPG